jgi:hypothetical protein
VADFGIWNDLSERMQRERILRDLPKEARRKYHLAVGLKLLFVVLFIVEVLVLQRSK